MLGRGIEAGSGGGTGGGVFPEGGRVGRGAGIACEYFFSMLVAREGKEYVRPSVLRGSLLVLFL